MVRPGSHRCVEKLDSINTDSNQSRNLALLDPVDKLASVLRNRNLLQAYSANCAIVTAEGGMLGPRCGLLKDKHWGAMPPISSAQAALRC